MHFFWITFEGETRKCLKESFSPIIVDAILPDHLYMVLVSTFINGILCKTAQTCCASYFDYRRMFEGEGEFKDV